MIFTGRRPEWFEPRGHGDAEGRNIRLRLRVGDRQDQIVAQKVEAGIDAVLLDKPGMQPGGMHTHIAHIQDKVLRQFMLNFQTPVLDHSRLAKFRRNIGRRLSIQQRWVFGVRRGRVTGEARVG